MIYLLTSSFKALPALNAGALEAGIFISSLVWGFLPYIINEETGWVVQKIYEMLKIGTLPTDVAQWLNDKEVIYQNHGDIIFFDWESDGTSDHVGIVEKCENEKVYTKDGNRATIIDVREKNEYFAEVVNAYGQTVAKRNIIDEEIK